MFRLLHRGRWKVRDTSVHEWAKQRFRSAMLELDTIVKRVLVDNTIREMPTTLYVLTRPYAVLIAYLTTV
jgi:hypothetical protein